MNKEECETMKSWIRKLHHGFPENYAESLEWLRGIREFMKDMVIRKETHLQTARETTARIYNKPMPKKKDTVKEMYYSEDWQKIQEAEPK